jgi:hypothetical protein
MINWLSARQGSVGDAPLQHVSYLQCDEDQSGAGFKFSAGRTRRNSGIESAIKRAETEIYPVDHEAYFQHISAQ